MEAKHTALPWRSSKNRLAVTGINADGRDFDIAYTHQGNADHRTRDEREADMDFIVRACNTYDDLVNALKQIAKNDPYRQSSAGIIARAALSKIGVSK